MSSGSDAPTYSEPGELLFHFTRADTAFQHILPAGQLLFRPYARMRDPLEAREWHFDLDGVDNEALEHLGPLVLDALNLLRTHAWLASFTVDAPAGDDPIEASFARGYARARMWEQYGDVHRGVCLCFRREFEQLVRARSSPESPVRSRRVRYTPAGFSGSQARIVEGAIVNAAWAEVRHALPRYDPTKDGALGDFLVRECTESIEAMSKALNAHVTRHLDDFLFLKTTDWASEHEHRIIVGEVPTEGLAGVLVPFDDTLTAVILGEHFPGWQIPAARAACERRDVELLQMRWVRGIPAPRELS